ncbi:YfhO family protein [Neoactinobaculum massilliense]|uniref:YfhO family protein n=1 Tax=Neoactinobaculum massilliense TaxID=2364794 RepID=UPI000F53DF9D|nr:YfhO family protein [Neoactinobaculum massilliense]
MNQPEDGTAASESSAAEAAGAAVMGAKARAGKNLGSPMRVLDNLLAIIGWIGVLLFAVVTVGPGLTGNQVFLGTENLTGVAPYSITEQTQRATNEAIGDTIDSVAPESLFITEAAKDGHYPQWNPYALGGSESGALPNVALLSPLSLPWWILPAAMAPAAVKLLEFAAIGLGFYLLLQRGWGLARVAAPVATLVFMTCGFELSWTNWPQTRVAALIPLVIWALDRLATRMNWWYAVAFGAVLAAMLLGGFPAVTAYTAYLGVAWFVTRVIAARQSVREIGRHLLRVILGGAIGLGLSAIQILPFGWFATHYVDFSARQFGTSHIPVESLVTAVFPFTYGGPEGTLWPLIWIESMSYVGVIALGLAVIGMMLRGRSPRGMSALVAIVLAYLTVALYLGGPLLAVLMKLPGVAGSFSGRMRVIWGFMVAVAAAKGMGQLLELSPRILAEEFQRGAWPVIRALMVCVLAGMLIKSGVAALGVTKSPLLIQDIKFAVGAVVLLMGAFVVALVWRNFYVRFVLFSGLIGAMVLQNAIVARQWWPLSPASTFYPTTATHQYLEQHIGEDRLIGVGSTLMPGTTDAYGLRAMGGHKFLDPRMADLLNAVSADNQVTATYYTLNVSDPEEWAHGPVLDRIGVKYVVTDPGQSFGATFDRDLSVLTKSTTLADSVQRSDVHSGPASGFTVRLDSAVGPEVTATLTGRVVTDAGKQVAEFTYDLRGGSPTRYIPVPALEHVKAGTRWHVEMSVNGTPVVAAQNDDGTVATSAFSTAGTGLRLVYSGDTLILQRESALPRVRWASQATLETEAQGQLNALESGQLASDEVVVERQEDLHPEAAGSTATVKATTDNADEQTITVHSDGPGWVVIADSMRDNGWQAELDGENAELVPVDHAYVAVYVSEAGDHTIHLQYHAPLFAAGRTVSIVTLVAIAVCAGVGTVRRRSDRRRQHESSRG